MPALPRHRKQLATVQRLTIQQHDLWYQKSQERREWIAWALSWQPNFFVTLVLPHKGCTEHDAREIGRRFLAMLQRELFGEHRKGRNKRKFHIGKVILIIEYSSETGWHLHGVGWVPDSHLPEVLSCADQWWADQVHDYMTYPSTQRPSSVRFRTSSKIVPLDSTEARIKSTQYAAKMWHYSGKSEPDRTLLSGYHAQAIHDG